MELLMTQALDERDFLNKKIIDKIRKTKFTAAAANNQTAIVDGKTKEEFAEKVKSDFQSLTDLVKRYESLTRAIIRSNAETKITINGNEMSVAEAIALRQSITNSASYHMALLCDYMRADYDRSAENAAASNEVLQQRVTQMYLNLVGGETEGKREAQTVVEEYRKANEVCVIDPLGVVELVEQRRTQISEMLTEINTKIKISNATTMISF